jgi:DNA primase
VTEPSSSDARNRVAQAINIVELIGQTVKLKRAGNKYVGLCPFHTEKSPSFSVDPAKGFFHCFGCKAGGDIFNFVMRRDRVEFREALATLARQAGVELPRYGVSKQNTSERQVLLDAHSVACGLFEKSLSHAQLGQAAREYLAKRGFTAETIKRFQIGLALDSWDALLTSPAMKKFTPQQLALAGLVKPRTEGQGFYDTFRNRIIFPIKDEQGRIIAFGGRKMPDSEDPAKYLNSPETPLFSKSRCLFGLDQAKAKIVESKTVAIVEGYTDVVMAHQFGATNVVSPLGTALTEQHVGILRRFGERIVLLFDADTAGDLAVNRAVELLIAHQIEITIAAMPDGLDPDEYLMQRGLESFEQLLAGGQDVLGYKWKQLLKDFGAKDDLTSQQRAIEEYLSLLAGGRGSGAVDPLRWGAILARVSRLTEIPAEELNRRFRAKPRKATPTPGAPQNAEQGENGSPEPARPVTAQDRAERWLLGALLAQPSRWTDVQKSVQPVDFSDPSRRKLAEALWNRHRDEGEPEFSEMLGQIEDDELKGLAISVFEELQAMGSLEQSLTDALSYLHGARRSKNEKATGQGQSEVDALIEAQKRARLRDIRRPAS